MSLGLEKLAVGRSDLRPLRGTANSPSHLRDINMPRASIFEDKRCEKSLGLEKLAVGRYDLLPLRGTANSPSTLMGNTVPGHLCLMAKYAGSFWVETWYERTVPLFVICE